LRAAVAFISLGALAFDCMTPTLASGIVEPQELDPRFVALLKSRTCGTQTASSYSDARAAATRLAAAEPVRESSADTASFVALDTDQSSPEPSASPSAPPTATPTFIPIPPVNNAGPQQIVPPAPRPLNPTPTPYPLPTASPTANPSAPVFLVRPSGTPGPIQPRGQGGSPTPIPYASPAPTLGPFQVVTIADSIVGSSDTTKPSDLSGNVHVFYTEGQIVGDRAHYDGDHTIVLRGHTYLVNRAQDSILYADQITFDLATRHATLMNGSGESIEGVQQGKLHYYASQLTARSDGVTHGDHASFTTCENPHAGYHVEARSLDVTPGDKLVARKAVVFLGPTAILYLPLLVIPLVQSVAGSRRTASFIPVVGYDSVEGAYIKARIGFGATETYYGYYRVEYYTKRGLGLGYVAYIGAKDAHRYTTIDSYTISDRIQDARETNVTIADTENFSRHLRAQLGASYQGDFGPTLSLPASLNLTASLVHQGPVSTENLTFSRFLQGTLSDNLNLGLIDSLSLSPELQEEINLAYAKFNSPGSTNDTFQIDSETHLYSKFADYTLTYDKTNYSSGDFGYDKIPELDILPHFAQGNEHFLPQLEFALGDYSERENAFNTTRAQAQINEQLYLKVFGNSDLSADYNLTQDYYGTGDEKAFDQQNVALQTPIGNHIINSLTYNEDHPIGPIDVPFQLFDRLSPAAHSAQEVFRFYNKDVYSFSLAGGTDFDEQAQPVNYQLNVRPSGRSYVVFGGYFTPGGGLGFNSTNVQAITPFGRDTTLELSTNVDWKNHNRLEDKNIYLTRTIDGCYNLQLTYNEDLKAFNFNVVILAFPGQPNGFGLAGGQSSTVVPGSLGF
jgi:hypothetical protein